MLAFRGMAHGVGSEPEYFDVFEGALWARLESRWVAEKYRLKPRRRRQPAGQRLVSADERSCRQGIPFTLSEMCAFPMTFHVECVAPLVKRGARTAPTSAGGRAVCRLAQAGGDVTRSGMPRTLGGMAAGTSGNMGMEPVSSFDRAEPATAPAPTR